MTLTAEAFLKAKMSLKDVPTEQRSRDVCEAAIKVDGANLQYVPLPLRTVRLTRLACGTRPIAYKFAPAGVRADYDLAKFALRRGGIPVWQMVPPEIVDFDLCLTAVKGAGAVLKLIPERHKTFELCKTAYTKGGADLKDVPAAYLQDPSFWHDVALKHIPDEHKTRELCMRGVRKCGMHLQYVPLDLRDVLVCNAAVVENTWAYRFVPDRYHGLEWFQEAYSMARAAGSPFPIDSLERKTA